MPINNLHVSFFNLKTIIIVILACCLLFEFTYSLEKTAEPKNKDKKIENVNNLSQLEIYQRLFKTKRASQNDAVKSIVALDSKEKQLKMLHILFQKLFKIMKEQQIVLSSQGFHPGDEFPENQKLKEILSTVLENTVFLSELILRLPDTCESLISKNNEWLLLTKWGIHFTNSTGFLENTDTLLLNLVAQELHMVERDKNYINPFREETQKMKKKMEETKNVLKTKTEKKKKKNKKGPQLSRSEF